MPTVLESLQRFVEELRRRGLPVSPAESIDAARAASAVGVESRAQFRAALSATLAKGRSESAVFREAFDAFFLPPPRGDRSGDRGRGSGGAEGAGGGGAGGAAAGRASDRRRPQRPDEEPEPGTGRPRGPGGPPPPGPPRLRVLRGDEARKAIQGGPSRDDAKRPRHRVHSEPRRRSGQDPGGRAAKGPDRGPARETRDVAGPARPRLSRLLAAPVREREAAHPRHRDLARPVGSDEEARLAKEIPRILEEIRLRRSRRMRRATRGRAWMKRAIRENLVTGGVPFQIPTRSAKPKRSGVILLVDVSRSTARAAGLFLLLALELVKARGRRTKVFFFVDHPVDATGALQAWLRGSPPPPAAPGGRAAERSGRGQALHRADRAPAPGISHRGTPRLRGRRGDSPGAGIAARASDRTFLDVVRGLEGLDPDAASDYGRTFYALSSGPLRGLARDSVLVVLGDARSNFAEPLEWAFEEIASRARRVIWMIPEERARWGTGDSVLGRYLPFCDVAVEARDLDGLAHGVREMLGSL